MEFLLTLFKAILIIFGVSIGTMVLFSIGFIVYVRKAAKGKLYAFFFETNRQMATELMSIDIEDSAQRVRSKDGGDYIVAPERTFWYSWPPGFPDWVREPIPAAVYIRNRAEPLDPRDANSIVSAKSLKYMLDEGMLKQTWKDARESIGETKVFRKDNLVLYINIFIIVIILGLGYFTWETFSKVLEISEHLGL
jgi:hypothetical protein